MSKPVAPSFREWVAQTFGLPKGVSSPQNKVSDAEAVESFKTWFSAILSTWDGDVVRETDKRKSSDTERQARTDDFRQQARARLEYLEFQFQQEQQLQKIGKKAPSMEQIWCFLRNAEIAAKDIPCHRDAEYWRVWLESVMRDWEGDASQMKDHVKKGSPMADGVVEGMKEFRELEDYMEKREIESAKDEEREPVAYNWFPENRTHVQQVNWCLG
ncbi:hypothetical protein Q7P36_002587 [Cladosporium allicinum]